MFLLTHFSESWILSFILEHELDPFVLAWDLALEHPPWFAVSETLFLFLVTKDQVPASNNSICLCKYHEMWFRFNRSFDQLWK